MPISHLNAFAQAADDYTYYSTVYKPAAAGVSASAQRYLDASYSGGIPKFNAYAGSALVATPMYGSGNAGIYTGPDAPVGKDKYIYQATFHHDAGTDTNSAGANLLVFCDYLMFYPLVDLSDDTLQSFDNTMSLPRYTDGMGVMVMMVQTVAGTINTTATMNYTDSEGVARTTTFGVQNGNVSGLVSTASASNSETAITPFISVAASGVRSIQSIQMTSPGEGFVSLVLVRPLFNMNLDFWQVSAEKNFILNGAHPIKIEPGAYLSFITKNRTSNRQFNIRGEILSTFL